MPIWGCLVALVAPMKGLLQCMSPRDLNINKFRYTYRTWIYDLPAKVKTGDIVLFSSKHSTSYVCRHEPRSPLAGTRHCAASLC